MQETDTPRPRKKGQKENAPDLSSEQAPRPDRIALTIDASTGAVIQIEAIDGSGARHELSESEKKVLTKENGSLKLEDVLERTFEAGIACVLGGDAETEKSAETKEDAELRHILLQPLLEESTAAKLMKREVLDRAIIGTLIRNSLISRAAGAQADAKPHPDHDSAAPKAS